MQAILISEENLPKILEVRKLKVYEVGDLPRHYGKDRYMIRGYVNPHGEFFSHTIMVRNIFIQEFEHDPEKIKTDWDQIVRIEPNPYII